jgi:hypothetical protein
MMELCGYLVYRVILVLYGKYHLYFVWPGYKKSTGFAQANLFCLSQSKLDL